MMNIIARWRGFEIDSSESSYQFLGGKGLKGMASLFLAVANSRFLTRSKSLFIYEPVFDEIESLVEKRKDEKLLKILQRYEKAIFEVGSWNEDEGDMDEIQIAFMAGKAGKRDLATLMKFVEKNAREVFKKEILNDVKKKYSSIQMRPFGDAEDTLLPILTMDCSLIGLDKLEPSMREEARESLGSGLSIYSMMGEEDAGEMSDWAAESVAKKAPFRLDLHVFPDGTWDISGYWFSDGQMDSGYYNFLFDLIGEQGA